MSTRSLLRPLEDISDPRVVVAHRFGHGRDPGGRCPACGCDGWSHAGETSVCTCCGGRCSDDRRTGEMGRG